MKRLLPYYLAVVLTLLFSLPSQASAYTYGDENTEDVAETFKLVQSALAGGAPDWKSAEEAYKVRRSELQSHFGDSVVITLDNNLKSQDASLMIANFKAVLVMNLERRFSYAGKALDDYAGSKMLLAKARATYETLSPFVPSKDKEYRQAFEDALTALGNPGLFGVGKKEVDPEAFKDRTDFIYKGLKPLFPFKAYVKPAKPAEESKPSPTPKPSASSQAPEETAKTEEASPSPSEEAVEASPEPSASAVASESAEPQAVSEASETAAPANAEPSAEPSAESSLEAAPTKLAEAAAAEHAPMERTEKTNPWITVGAIGGVIVIGGGVWLARKKGII